MPRANGFTLIELVIVTVVIGIMAAVLAPLMLSSLRAYDDTLGDVVVLDKLRYATERLAREIREVNYDSTNGFAFTSMGASSVAFNRAFHDSNGTLTNSDVIVCSNTVSVVNLAYATSCTGAPVLTDELGSLAFSYFNQSGVPLTIPPIPPAASAVRAVEIQLILRHNNNDYLQRTRVELKNFIQP